jgi:hypothetical protein
MTKELRAAMRSCAPTLGVASARRIMQEVETLMQNGYAAKSFKLFWHSTLAKYMFPVQYDFLKPRLPSQSSLTFAFEEKALARKDVDGGARAFFAALEAYDACVSREYDAVDPCVAQWLALIVSPIAMARARERAPSAFEDASSRGALPPRWQSTCEAEKTLSEQWDAFTHAALDILGEMLEKTSSESTPRDAAEIGLLNKSDCASALLYLVADGPMLHHEQLEIKWSNAHVPHDGVGERVRAFARTKRTKSDWYNANKPLNAIDVAHIRACLEQSNAV